MELGELIQIARSAKFKSARQFFKSNNLSCTYFYYSSVERGAAIPSVNLALEIFNALRIDKREGLLAWARSQMPDQSSKAVFADALITNKHKTAEIAATETLVINRSQAKFLEENPLAMELLTFITCCDDDAHIAIDDLIRHFRISRTKLKNLLSQLYEQSLIEKDEENNFYAREWVLVPFTREFEPVNDTIFSRAYEQFYRADHKDRVRHVVTVRLDQFQRSELEARLRALVNWAAQAGNKDSADATPYTLGAFASPRRFGDAD